MGALGRREVSSAVKNERAGGAMSWRHASPFDSNRRRSARAAGVLATAAKGSNPAGRDVLADTQATLGAMEWRVNSH